MLKLLGKNIFTLLCSFLLFILSTVQCIYFLFVLQDAGNWGPQIPQRLGHILSDATPGVLMVIVVSTAKLTCLKRPLSKSPQIGFQDQLSLDAGQKYCRMLCNTFDFH